MKQFFGVGTYTEPILFGTGEVFQGKGKGLYICAFEDENINVVSSIPLRNPSFFCYEPTFNKIYAVNEGKEFNGHYGGGITEISLDKNLNLTINASFCTAGTDPCHIAVAPNKKFVAVANFASGSTSVFRLGNDGRLISGSQVFQDEGSSIHPVRQKGPHAHSVLFNDSNNMFVPDLGTDCLYAFAFCGESVFSQPEKNVKLATGNGPRFGEFSTDYKHFYLINEIASSVTHFKCEKGKMIEQETNSTIPSDFHDNNICSDLHISKDGKYLYASNRGHDSITVFGIDCQNGSLNFVDRVYCGGRTPRNFCIDPTGNYLLVGNQDSDNITIFKIDSNGIPYKISTVDFPSPVCIRFL